MRISKNQINKKYTIFFTRSVLVVAVQFLFLISTTQAQDSPEQLLSQGVIQYEMGEFNTAAETLQKAFKKGLFDKEHLIQVHMYLAFSYAMLGETEKAKSAFLQLLAYDPNFELPESVSSELIEPFEQARRVDRQPPKIVHTPIKSAPENVPLEIRATVTDPSGVKNVTLKYRSATARHYQAVEMSELGNGNYKATIPQEEVSKGTLSYYIEAADKVNNTGNQGTDRQPIFVQVGLVDTEPPEITHTPVKKAKEGESLSIITVVIDNLKVAEVKLYYRLRGQFEFQVVDMQNTEGDIYIAELTAKPEGMEYYIQASDAYGDTPALWKSPGRPQQIKVQKLSNGGSKRLLWIGVGAAAVGGGAAVFLFRGGNSDRLPDPPGPPDKR